MSSLTLYYGTSTCAHAVRIALNEAGAEHTLVRMDFKAQQQRTPEYLAINPKGRVPALVTEHGVLTETPALLAYVAQRFPAARLAPTDPHGFARMQEFNSYLASTVHVAHAHRPRASRWADEPEAIAAMQRKVGANMTECFDLIERQLDGPWVLGEAYSVSDGYLFTVGGWLQSDGVDIARFPKVHAHAQRVAVRPAVQRSME
ncbi:glutathione S-transferase family protein [Acidovorax sp. NCPPB 3576]|uniref:glutathione S-transferase family protein n=1 Tax=Acidovorax sp. NCPPB 3576 TaxID=2940488 RepID=UPI0023490225|nr:glutathione S-transferase family protein [Acidovorax sp. NCPPB 3576]WCM88124.1 glutathione S-transferase family protein [Acidovorax sp. NCPPB 3576]